MRRPPASRRRGSCGAAIRTWRRAQLRADAARGATPVTTSTNRRPVHLHRRLDAAAAASASPSADHRERGTPAALERMLRERLLELDVRARQRPRCPRSRVRVREPVQRPRIVGMDGGHRREHRDRAAPRAHLHRTTRSRTRARPPGSRRDHRSTSARPRSRSRARHRPAADRSTSPRSSAASAEARDRQVREADEERHHALDGASRKRIHSHARSATVAAVTTRTSQKRRHAFGRALVLDDQPARPQHVLHLQRPCAQDVPQGCRRGCARPPHPARAGPTRRSAR